MSSGVRWKSGRRIFSVTRMLVQVSSNGRVCGVATHLVFEPTIEPVCVASLMERSDECLGATRTRVTLSLLWETIRPRLFF